MPFDRMLVVCCRVELVHGDTTLKPESPSFQGDPANVWGGLRVIIQTKQANDRFPWLCLFLLLIEKRAGQTAEIVEHEHRSRPAERQTAGRRVNEHQAEVNTERDCQTASGEHEMAATIENQRGKGADGEFETEKRPIAMREQTRHECVAFSGEIHVQPEKRELGIEPIESEQQQAFGQCAHLDPLRLTLLNLRLLRQNPRR